jgi:hypothetical protein
MGIFATAGIIFRFPKARIFTRCHFVSRFALANLLLSTGLKKKKKKGEQ